MPLLPVLLLLVQAVISVHTELVAVPVIVTDAHGRHVSGLSQDNFRVYEDGRPQPIAVFLHGDVPITLGLVIDRSQSMRPKGQALSDAVSAILQSSRPDDELFAVDFNDRVSLALPDGRPFTHEGKALEAALTAVRAEGQTALYDGVAEGLQHLQLGHTEKHALIVVSDGGDNASRHKLGEVISRLAEQAGTLVYTIGIFDAEDQDQNPGILKRIAQATGGEAFFPRHLEDVVSTCEHIARDIRQQYTLGYVSNNPTRPGAHHAIRVVAHPRDEMPGKTKLTVRTRSGYTAGVQ